MPQHPTGTTGSDITSPDLSQSTSRGIVGKVKEQANSRLSSQKDRALDSLSGVTQAVKQTTQQLRDNQHDIIARYIEQAADQIERFSTNLKNKDVGELVEDAQRFARRQPAIFVGSAFALGLLGARFLKSSAPPEYRSEYGQTQYGSRYDRARYDRGLPSASSSTPSSRSTTGGYPGSEGF
jgi:hypothetical protein